MAKRRRGDGTIEHLPSGRFRVRWRENGRKQSETFPTLALAETFRRGRIGDIARERAGLKPDPAGIQPLDFHAQAWLERRRDTHRSWSEDRSRWNLHLKPFFGSVRPADVDVAMIRRFCETETRAKTNKDTLRLYIRCASSLFTDLCERRKETGVDHNPFFGLPRDLKRLYRSDYDHRFTPYIERLLDVVRLYQALPEAQAVAYAIGVVAGLRPGETLGLDWTDIRDEERIDVRRQVQDGKLGPLKDNEARILTGAFLAPLWPVLKRWRVRTGGSGPLFPGTLLKAHGRRAGDFIHPRRLTEAMVEQKVVDVKGWSKPWYFATRHTFASHWVRAGHPLAELALVMGHSSTYVTEHYAHIRPSPDRQGDPWTLDLAMDVGRVVELGPRTAHGSGHRKRRRSSGND